LRASDGTNLGTFPVGRVPQAAAYDGNNIWVTNYLDGTVTELRASDGVGRGHIPRRSNSHWHRFRWNERLDSESVR